MNSFEDFNSGVGIEAQPIEKEKKGEEAPENSAPYMESILDQTSLEARISDLQKKIEETPHLNDEELLGLQNELAVAERDLEEAIESSTIEHRRRQEFNRTRHEEALNTRKKEEMDEDFDEGLVMNAEIDAKQKDADWDKAIATNARIDILTGERRDEANKMNEEFDVQKIYDNSRTSVERSVAHYSKLVRNIEGQKNLVASLNERAKAEDLKYGQEIKALKDGGIAFGDPKVQGLVKEWSEAQSKRTEEAETLANMEKQFPAKEAEAKKFLANYWGDTPEEHDAAQASFAKAIKSADSLEGVFNVVSSLGAIPQEDTFVTNTKFRDDMDKAFAMNNEAKSLAAIRKITTNLDVRKKLLDLYSREVEGAKIRQKFEGASPEEHKASVERFSQEIRSVQDIPGLLSVVEKWGGIPEGSRYLTHAEFITNLNGILDLKDEEAKISALEGVTQNDEVCEKFLALYRKERDEVLTPVEEPFVPRRSMNQPNIEPKKEWKPTGSPEMIAELQKAKDNEKELQTLSSMISTDRFRLFPAALLATKKGRKALEMLEDMHAPMDSKYLRETSVPIAVSLRLKVARQIRENLEEQLGRDIRDSDRRVNAITEYPAGPIVIPDGNYRRPSASREQKELNEDRQGTWLSRLFSRSPGVSKKLNASDEKPRRPYRRTFNRKDEGSF